MPLGRPGHAAAEETARRATGSASRGRPGAAVDAGQAGGSAEGQRDAPVSAAQNAEVDWDAIFRTIGDQSVPTNEAGQGHRYSEGTVSRAYDLPEHLGPGGSSLLPRRGPERGQGGLSRASGAWPADFLSSDPSGNGLMSPFATGAAQGPVPSSRGGTPPRGPLHRSSSYPFHQDPFSFDQPNDHLSRSRGFPSEPSGSFDMPPPPPPLQHLAGYSEPMSFASSSSSAASSQHNLHTQLAAYTSTPLASPAQEAWDYMSRWGGGGHANQAEAEPSGRRHTLSHAQSGKYYLTKRTTLTELYSSTRRTSVTNRLSRSNAALKSCVRRRLGGQASP